jgi:hypothetical protein
MSVKSVKKKWSSKGFAAGVNRDIIAQGAQCSISRWNTSSPSPIEAMGESKRQKRSLGKWHLFDSNDAALIKHHGVMAVVVQILFLGVLTMMRCK